MKSGWLGLVFAVTAAAQSTASISLSFSGGGGGNNSNGFSLSGSGTLSPYGSATVSIDGGSGGIAFTFTLSDGDTLTASGSYSTAADLIDGNANVTGGTGAFAGSTGAFSFSINAPGGATASNVSFTMTGSGTVTGSATAGPGGSGYPVAGPGGSGYPVYGDGGSGEVACGLAFDGSTSGGAIWRPVQPHPADSLTSAAPSAGTSTNLYIATPIQSAAASYSATANCPATPNSCWITIPAGSATGSIAALSSAAIPVQVSLPGENAGVYQANVALTITPSGGAASTLTVPITGVIPAAAPVLTLSQTALQFQAVAGSTTPLAQFISVSDPATESFAFSAAASTLTGGNWLAVSPASGSVTAGTPVNVNVQVNPSGLAAGQYFGLVNFTAAGAANTLQAVEVALTILPPASTTGPLVSPAALTFVAPASGNPASQTVQFINLSNQALTVTASGGVQTASPWFTVAAPSNSVAAGETLTETIAVSTAGLAAGQYFATLDLHVQQLNADYYAGVVLVVPQAASATPPATTACTPTQLLPVFTNLEGGFQTQAGLPVSVQVLISDDCGNPLNSGAAVAYFSTGDASVALTSLGKGQWTGTWLPHKIAGGAASVGVIATSFSPALYGSAGATGTLAASAATPLINAGGVVSAASVAAGGPLPIAPGEFISIYGSNLAAAGQVTSATAPYPLQLGQVKAMLGGETMPLQVLSSGQINAIVPYDAALNSTQQVMVELNGSAYSMPEPVLVAAAQPSVFTQNQSGSGAGAILTAHASDGSVNLNTPSAPATAGDVLELYCTGLGTVSPSVAAGSAAPSMPLSYTTNTVTAAIGGQPAPVQFAGLAPGYAGLYQVNVTVPPGITPGAAVQVVLTEGDLASPPVTVAIQ